MCIDDWVARRVQSYYSEIDKDPTLVLSKGKPVRAEFEKHRQVMKAIRDRVFHKSEWYDDEVISDLTDKIFVARIPGRLHLMLVIYGINIVSSMLKDGIGIPGVGCFGVIPVLKHRCHQSCRTLQCPQLRLRLKPESKNRLKSPFLLSL